MLQGNEEFIIIDEQKFFYEETFHQAIESPSVNEAGSINTTQGLEFDYIGVIIGKDLRYENREVITDFKNELLPDWSLWEIKEIAY